MTGTSQMVQTLLFPPVKYSLHAITAAASAAFSLLVDRSRAFQARIPAPAHSQRAFPFCKNLGKKNNTPKANLRL